MNTMIKKVVGCVGLVMSLSLVAQAGQYWWAGDGVNLGGSGPWNTVSNNWRNGSASGSFTAWPNGGGDEAVFTNAVGGAAGTVTLSGTINANALSFKTNAWTLSGGTLNLGSGASTITMANVPANSDQTINSTLAGSGTLTVSGTASWGRGLYLTANNSNFTGKIVVDLTAGNLGLAVTNDNALGAVPATSTPDAITLKNGAYLVNASAGTLSLATNRGIRVLNGTSLLLNRNSTTTLVNSPISGGGGLWFRYGTFFINSTNNTHTGSMVIYNESAPTAVKAGAANVFSHGVGVGSFGFVRWNGGADTSLDLNGYSQILPGIWSDGQVNSGATPGRRIDNSAAGSVTLTIGDNNIDQGFDGLIKNTGGALSLTKVGTGTQWLTGTNAYTGVTTVNGGTLLFDKNVYNDALVGGLTLGGGTLSVYGAGASINSRQTFGNLTLDSGGNGIIVTNRGGNTTLTLGNTWSKNPGGTLLVTVIPGSGTSTLSSSPATNNGIIGGYAVVKDATGTGFATVTGGNVVRYTGATTLDATAAAANLDTNTNYVVSANQTLGGGNATQTVYSLVFNNGAVLTGGKTLMVGSGGLLFNSSGEAKTQNLKLTSGTGELDVYVGTANGQIQGEIKDNGATSVSFVRWGSGTLYLTGDFGVPSYSGNTVVNGGALAVSGAGNLIPDGVGKGNLVVNGSGSFVLIGNNEVINGLSSASAAAIVKNTASTTNVLTLGNNDATASFAGQIGPGGSLITLIKIGAGTQTLSGANIYTGGTIISNGVLSVSSTNNIGGASAKVTFAGGTLRITGTSFTNFNGVPLTFTSAGGGLDLVESGVVFTLTNDVPSGTSLTKTGSGSLSVSGSVASLVTDNRTRVSGSGSVANWTLKSLTGGAYTPAGIESVTGTLTLEGNYTFDLNTDGTGDKLTATGAVTMNSIVITIPVPANLTDRSKVYTLVQGSSLSGTASLAPACVLPYGWKLKKDGNALVVRYVSPGTMVSFF